MKTTTKIINPAFVLFALACVVLLPMARASDETVKFRNTVLLRPAPIITTFDVPGAGTGPNQGTFSVAINPAELITGDYQDASDVRHGFLRAPAGAITTFDAPGGGTGHLQGTRSVAINPAGTVAGYYRDASNVWHGYLRTPDGTITTFDVP